MSMHMPHPDSGHNVHIRGEPNELIVAEPSSELLHVGAVDVIETYDPRNVPHVVGKGIDE